MFEINKKFFLQLPISKQNQLRKKVEDHFKFYKNLDKKEEYEQNQEEGKEGSTNEEEMREAIKEMTLDDGILNVNLGIPIMIIWNKSDVVASADTAKYYQQRLEFIMKHLREFALRYGASIMFTSTKKGTNMQELYSYLLHRYYDTNPVSPELKNTFRSYSDTITNKESIFIPTGYDSPKLVQLLCPNIDDPYDKIVIRIKASREVADVEEIKWEDITTIIDSISEKQGENEDDTAQPSEAAVENVKKKKIDPNAFFNKLRQGAANNRDSTKTGEDEKPKNIEDFKKKLFMKNIE